MDAYLRFTFVEVVILAFVATMGFMKFNKGCGDREKLERYMDTMWNSVSVMFITYCICMIVCKLDLIEGKLDSLNKEVILIEEGL